MVIVGLVPGLGFGIVPIVSGNRHFWQLKISATAYPVIAGRLPMTPSVSLKPQQKLRGRYGYYGIIGNSHRNGLGVNTSHRQFAALA
jgi:hypothetical protein